MNPRSVLKQWLPPILLDALRQSALRLRASRLEWAYCPQGWPHADPKVKGWNVESIVQTQVAKWPGFLRATAGSEPLGVAHEAAEPRNDDLLAHHVTMAFAYVLALAAQGRERLSILDWGSGIGHYGILSRRLLPGTEIDYIGKDLPLLCQAGRQVLPDARFIERDDEAAVAAVQLAVASGSLQCSEDWRSVVRLLAGAATSHVYLTRLPIVRDHDSFVVLQRVYAYGYDTEVAYWFLNRQRLLDHAASVGLVLVREFIFGDHTVVPGAPEQARVMGFLFTAPAHAKQPEASSRAGGEAAG